VFCQRFHRRARLTFRPPGLRIKTQPKMPPPNVSPAAAFSFSGDGVLHNHNLPRITPDSATVSIAPAGARAGVSIWYQLRPPAAAVAGVYGIISPPVTIIGESTMPTRKRRSKVKPPPSPAVFTMRLDSAAVAALDALANAAPPIFPAGVRTRAARIRWLILNFGACHSRLRNAHAIATDNANAIDNMRAALAPFAHLLHRIESSPESALAAPRPDSGDLEF